MPFSSKACQANSGFRPDVSDHFLSFDNEVLDGMHRVAKAWMLGLKSVSAVRFDEPVDPDLVLDIKGNISPEKILKQHSSKRSEAQDEPCNTASNLSETAKTEN